MELSEDREQSANQSVDVTPAQTAAPSPVRSTGTTTPSYIYALGRVTPRFPSLAVEKEFAQALRQRKPRSVATLPAGDRSARRTAILPGSGRCKGPPETLLTSSSLSVDPSPRQRCAMGS